MELRPSHIDQSALLAAIDAPTAITNWLSTGSSAEVWHIYDNSRSFVLRSFSKRPPRCPLAMDITIRSQLAESGFRVARPIASSLDHPDISSSSTEWVVDEFISGTFQKRGALPKAVAQDIGITLAALHALPADGFGTPSEFSGNRIQGSETEPLPGLLCRFDNPLPQLLCDPEATQIIHRAPQLTESLIDAIDRIRSAMSSMPGVICHSDLHEQQFICNGDRLAALIDFGDATIAAPIWDFASLYYFHGPDVLANTLLGYSEDAEYRKDVHNSAMLFSIGIALHHASRSRWPGKEHRFAIALAHITKTLGLLPQ